MKMISRIPINRVDATTMRYDIFHRDNDDLFSRHKADRRMIQELNANRNPSLRERFERAIVDTNC